MRFTFTIYGEILARLDQIPKHLRSALIEKMNVVVDEVYAKVEENLSGKILQRKSGQLADSIQKGVEVQGDLLIGWVAPEPQNEKARALEEGGKGDYIIVPTKARLLSFYWELMGKRVALRYVTHPPSKAYGYLSSAILDVAAKAEAEFNEAIRMALQ